MTSNLNLNLNLNFNLHSTSADEARSRAALLAGAAVHDVEQQRLRILRCTAQAMASSPGGLRFKAGTRPWLDGLLVGLPDSGGQRGRFAPPAQRLAAH